MKLLTKNIPRILPGVGENNVMSAYTFKLKKDVKGSEMNLAMSDAAFTLSYLRSTPPNSVEYLDAMINYRKYSI